MAHLAVASFDHIFRYPLLSSNFTTSPSARRCLDLLILDLQSQRLHYGTCCRRQQYLRRTTQRHYPAIFTHKTTMSTHWYVTSSTVHHEFFD